MTPTVAAQRRPVSPIPVAPVNTPTNTPRANFITDPSDNDPSFPIPPPLLIKTVARKSKSFKHRTSIDPTFCDKQSTSALQNKLDEPFTYAIQPDMKTTSDNSS